MNIKYAVISRYKGYRFGTDGSMWTNLKKGPLRDTSKLFTGVWKARKQSVHSNGYIQIDIVDAVLHKNVKRFIHDLILEAFVGSRPEGMECRHLNGVRTDNRLENLCWGTRKENVQDKYRHGTVFNVLFGEDHANTKFKYADVQEMFRLRKEGLSYSKIGRIFGVGAPTTFRIVTGKRWSRYLNNISVVANGNGKHK